MTDTAVATTPVADTSTDTTTTDDIDFIPPPDANPDASAWDAGDDTETEAVPETEQVEAEEEPAEPEKITVKVNGKDVEITRDQEREYAMKYLAGENRLEAVKEAEAKAKRAEAEHQRHIKGYEGFQQVWQSRDPERISDMCHNVGIDFDTIAVERALQLMELSTLPEADQKNRQYEKQLQAFKDQEAARKQAEEEQQVQAAYTENGRRMVEAIPQALESVGLNNTPTTRRQIADLWLYAFDTNKLGMPQSPEDWLQQATLLANHVKMARDEENGAAPAPEVTPAPAAPAPAPKVEAPVKPKPKVVPKASKPKPSTPQYITMSELKRQRGW